MMTRGRKSDDVKQLLLLIALSVSWFYHFHVVWNLSSTDQTIQELQSHQVPPSSLTSTTGKINNNLPSGSHYERPDREPLTSLLEPGLSLELLTDANSPSYDCSANPNLTYFANLLLDNQTTASALNGLPHRKIPRIVHVTSKSRCLTQPFVDNIQKWHFPNHELYFHDDAAIDRLLMETHWEDFPHLPLAMKCLRSGAAKADLWRYVVLWQYGGIYTDIDNAPGPFWINDDDDPQPKQRNKNPAINNGSTIALEDDAFFVVEKLGVLSQFFLAASPKHPLLYLAIQQTLYRLLGVEHVGKQYIPQVTGPGALKVAFKTFMRVPKDSTQHGRVQAGHFVGLGGREVTVAGSKTTSWQLVNRGSVPEKIEGYTQMNMRHFSKIAKKKFNETCMVHIWNLDYGRYGPLGAGAAYVNLTNW